MMELRTDANWSCCVGHGVAHQPTDAPVPIGEWMNAVEAMMSGGNGKNSGSHAPASMRNSPSRAADAHHCRQACYSAGIERAFQPGRGRRQSGGNIRNGLRSVHETCGFNPLWCFDHRFWPNCRLSGLARDSSCKARGSAPDA